MKETTWLSKVKSDLYIEVTITIEPATDFTRKVRTEIEVALERIAQQNNLVLEEESPVTRSNG